MSKKEKQLGMNSSTASNRLVKDILFNFIKQEGIKCFHCDKAMTRDTFSIEHKIPWLDSDNPKELYFDLDNISFSHLSCNCSASRNSIDRNAPHPSIYYYNKKGCRCEGCKTIKKEWNSKRKQYPTGGTNIGL